MRFIYKTAHKKPPLGLQNIYISWCEGDGNELDKVVDDLLSTVRGADCAVWYDFEPDTGAFDRGALAGVLDRMNMAVFVVTNNMLRSRKRSLDVDLNMITGKSIAVLPILMEGVDPGEFEYCFPGIGGISRDDEFFRDRLQGALNYLLCDPELLAEIRRDAFCGTINILTHAKDRGYLADMQKTIHDIEFCRDFAITADDPLGVYQEEEQDTLRRINDADVTLFTVTPNILHSSGSMAQTFFPNLRDGLHPFIPVEAAETKLSKLQSIYKRIPEPVSLDDEQLLRERLGDLIGEKSIGHDSSRHRYMMGMAYLNGIGVEIDRDRGRRLISSAASSGLYEAEEKLAQMYSTGVNIPIDLESAVTWHRKIIENETRIYNSSTTLDNAASLAATLNKLGEYYNRLDKPDKAENAYVNVGSLCSRRLRSETHHELILQYAISCTELGKLKDRKFNVKGAEDHYRHAKACLNKLLLGSPTYDVMHRIADVSMRLGDICMARGQVEEAEAEYRCAYERLDFLATEAKLPEYSRELVKCLHKMSPLYERDGDRDRAVECCLIAYDISRQAYERCGTISSTKDFSHAASQLGMQRMETGDTAEAKRYFDQAVELCENAYAQINAGDIARELIANLEMLCIIAESEGRAADLLSYRAKIVDIRRNRSEKYPDDTKLAELRAEACCRAADACTSQSERRRYSDEAAEIYEELRKTTGRAEYHDLAIGAKRRTGSSGIITEKVRLRHSK